MLRFSLTVSSLLLLSACSFPMMKQNTVTAQESVSQDSGWVNAESLPDGCKLVQRDLTKPVENANYWCKNSAFINRQLMKTVKVNPNSTISVDY